MKINIIIATHKETTFPRNSKLYIPIQVGSINKESISWCWRDDVGENISHKNPYYCELTGLYWAWKNMDCDYLGLVHYRRYFSTLKTNKNKEDIDTLILSEEEIRELLNSHDIILPKKRNYYIETLYSHYKNTFSGEHLDLSREIILDISPEYIPAFDKVMKKRGGYMFNMFIMNKKLSDQYCIWLFSVLDKLYEKIDLTGYTDFEARLFGRVSEILFNVWLEKHKFRVKSVPFVYIGKIDWFRKISSFLLSKFFGIKYKRSF
ncbi:exopolysaccharide biosynthesis protein [Mannheimia varigena]|uniref:DUF4422 domain-containing protein n=1 Tax=Mannheimia varigena TaxID=85404 RepID=UPI00159E04A1|nr:DUF4422 domain-containing protein [Mannheimia varigena]QLB17521.1 exopolysaccharide biosynthesis protein [Mannheimia varigena]